MHLQTFWPFWPFLLLLGCQTAVGKEGHQAILSAAQAMTEEGKWRKVAKSHPKAMCRAGNADVPSEFYKARQLL